MVVPPAEVGECARVREVGRDPLAELFGDTAWVMVTPAFADDACATTPLGSVMLPPVIATAGCCCRW